MRSRPAIEPLPIRAGRRRLFKFGVINESGVEAAKSGDPHDGPRKLLFRGKEHSMQDSIASGLRCGLEASPSKIKVLLGFFIAALLFFALTSASVNVFAQQKSALIEGTVVDPRGAGIAGARVSLGPTTEAAAGETRTDAEGKFRFSKIHEGDYQIIAEAAGFTQSTKTNISVRSDKSEAVTITLQVAAISDSVVVTATRTQTPLSEFGGTVSVINDGDLSRGAYTNVSESLRLVPGLAVVQTGGRGGLTSIFIRGGESDYNKVLIDGVPVNQAGGAFDFFALTPENLERIEVVRGPQSALFGSDAMAGAIQLITRRGYSSTPKFDLSAEGGSFDFHRETAVLSGARRWFDYSGSFGFQSTDGRFNNNDYINRSASLNLGFKLSPSADLRVTSRWNDSRQGVPGPTATLFADPDQRQKHRDIALSGALDFRTGSRWSHNARFVYSEFGTNSFDPAAQDLTQPGTPPLPPFGFGFDSAFAFNDHEKRIGAHFQSTAAIGRSNLFVAGVDVEHESAVFSNSDIFSQSRVSPDRNNLGIFLQDQLAWRDLLFITAGVRAERNSSTVPSDLRAVLAQLGSFVPDGDVGFGWTANPRIALALVARRHREESRVGLSTIRASFGTGIKEPTLTEAFSPSPFFLGNPNLNPERAISYEIGLSQEFYSRRARVDFTYFDNRFRDIITFESTTSFGPITLPTGRLTHFINTDRSSARGVELTATALAGGVFRSRLKLTGSYTFLRSRLDQAADVLVFAPPTFEGVFRPNPEIGLPLLRRPRHSGYFEVGWIAHRFDAAITGVLVGSRRDFDAVRFAKFDANGKPIFNDGYAKLDASGSYRFNRYLSAFARIENLLNEDYQEVLGFPAYRLNFTAGLRLRLGGDRGL